MRRKSSKNGSTPKFVSAEPKNTGDSSPLRTCVHIKFAPRAIAAPRRRISCAVPPLADQLRHTLLVVQVNLQLDPRGFCPETPEKNSS